MVALKDAVKAARQYLDMVYEGKAQFVRMEEVEDSESPLGWRITLSFALPGIDDPGTNQLLEQFAKTLGTSMGPAYPRHMKVFVIDQFGRARAMKNREP